MGVIGEIAAPEVGAFAEEAPGREAVEARAKMAMLALTAWCQGLELQRIVTRPADFYQTLVEALWTAQVQTVEDLAALEDPIETQLISGTPPSPGLRGFFRKAFASARDEYPQVVSAGAPTPNFNMSSSQDQLAQRQLEVTEQQLKLFEQIGKKSAAVEPTPSVDMCVELTRLSLGNLPQDSMPCGESTDKLLGRAEKLAKTKKFPFVNMKLTAFLPPHARDGFTANDSDDENESESFKAMQKVMGVKKKVSTLNFLQCMEALHRYVIAGAMCKQFSLATGLAHISNVMNAATKAGKERKRHAVAVTYDHMVREKLATAAYHAGRTGNFDIDIEMCKFDERIYKEALVAFEAPKAIEKQNFERRPAEASGFGGLKTKFTGTCNFRGKEGHRKIDCFKFKGQQKRKNGGEEEVGPTKRFKPY
jgi:hypothetical protein